METKYRVSLKGEHKEIDILAAQRLEEPNKQLKGKEADTGWTESESSWERKLGKMPGAEISLEKLETGQEHHHESLRSPKKDTQNGALLSRRRAGALSSLNRAPVGLTKAIWPRQQFTSQGTEQAMSSGGLLSAVWSPKPGQREGGYFSRK